MSFLTRLSLANRGLVALIAVVITGFGVYAIPSLKQQLLPSLEFPGAFINAAMPGAGPEIIEQQVTQPIENAVKGADGLESIESTTREGSATIQVRFVFGTDITAAVNQLTTAVNRVQPTLPATVQPTIFAGSTDDIPAIVLAASGGAGEADLATALDRTVVPELTAITGVRDVTVTGTRSQQVVITPNRNKLALAGVPASSITTLLQANGVAVPAGSVTDGTRALNVQVGTPIQSLDQLRGLSLAGTRKTVKLGEVATVVSRLATATSYTRTDGVDSLGVAVTAAPDGNPVQISHEVRDKLAALRASSGAKLTVVVDQAPFVEKSIKSLTTEGLLGLLMAVIVILVFLLSIRSTLVTAVSIPLSVLVALIGLRVSHYSLDLLTLGALTIAVGRVVDDSIVVLENIKRHLGYGEEKVAAIRAGVREVAGAVTASTLTTVAVFAPIALVGGYVGELFAPFAVTVTVALLASLLVALTVVPVLAYWFLRPALGGALSAVAGSGAGGAPAAGTDPREQARAAEIRQAAEERERRSPLQRGYLPVIEFAMRRQWTTVGIGALVLVATFGLAMTLQTNFLDQSGQRTVTVSQQLPAGTSLAATDAAARRVEGVIAARKDVATYQVTVGNGDFNPFVGSGGVSGARFTIALKDGTDTTKAIDQLRAGIVRLGDAGEVTVGGESGTGVNANQLSVTVAAADPAVLATATEQVRQAMAGTAHVTDVGTSLVANVPRLDAQVNRAKAATYGLTEAGVGRSVAAAFRPVPAGQVTFDNATQDVVISFGAPPADVAALRALPIGTPRGTVTLSQIATVREVAGPEEVTRVDGNRSATVTGTATGSNVGGVSRDLTKRLAALSLPGGATYRIGGVSQQQKDAFGDLGLALLAAIAIVFVIMVAAFRSLLQPVILLISIPFAATGAICLLLATGTPLGVPALIGALMLVGVVVTNAIVLMDLINHYRREGMGVREAVIEGGRHRLRPILMTAIATIFALLPMALGLTGEGGFISQPLAIVVIGGLVSSTLLTLVLVPTLYTMVEDGTERIRAYGEIRRQRRAANAAFAAATGGARDPGRHAAHGRPAGTEMPVPAANGGAHAAAEDEKSGAVRVEPSGALRGYTDQFEVLKVPRRPPTRP